MSSRDLYQVLGIGREASPADIRAAFVRLARLHHPDAPGNHQAPPWRLQEVQDAYHCLSNPETRSVHDRLLAENDREHFAKQRRVRRRLYRYDHRHPPSARQSRPPLGWRTVALIAITAALATPVARYLVG